MNQTLKARIKARITANEHAIKLYKTLAEIFDPLVGKQVLTAQMLLLAKYRALVPDLPSTPGLAIFRHRTDHSLAWTVKVCVNIEGGTYCGCVYEEATVYVGTLSGQVLTELSEPFEGRTDYTVEEVEKARREYKKAQKAADNLRSALFPFGESDR
jgi:hypothetical protein